MEDLLGLISLYENEADLKEITSHRPLAAVPFAGRYRIIDFVLSSMVNAGIDTVGILTGCKYRSLMDHLRSGKEWDLARKRDGLFILPSQLNSGNSSCQGDVQTYYANLDFIENCRQKYVLIAHSGIICNVDFAKVVRQHQTMQADITVLYKEEDEEYKDYLHSTIIECNDNGIITDIAVMPGKRRSNKVSLEMYIIGRELLIDMINDCVARGGIDFLKDGIMRKMSELKIVGGQIKGYLANIHSVNSYYRYSMELLKLEKWQDLFFKSGLVYTKIKDEGPTKYSESANVVNSIIASGCIIDGRVENSILFRGVRVAEGAYIKDSIIMQRGNIGTNSMLENTICDKYVRIEEGVRLRGERQYPLVIAKGSVI